MSELYEKSLLKLELDQVLALLAECAGSAGGKESCLALVPTSDLEDVNALLEAEPESLYPNEVLLMDWSTATALTAELAEERYVFTPAVR